MLATKESRQKGGKKAGAKDRKNPARVAEKVIEQIKKKELVSVKKAMEDVGYSQTTARAKTGLITRNPEYLRVMNNFLGSLKEKSAMSLAHINEKKLEKSSARELAQITDILTKNANLIEGKPTNINAGIGFLLHKIEQGDKDKDLPN